MKRPIFYISISVFSCTPPTLQNTDLYCKKAIIENKLETVTHFHIVWERWGSEDVKGFFDPSLTSYLKDHWNPLAVSN